MSRTPACDAIAEDPAFPLFKASLERLLSAPDYASQHLEVNRLQGHLAGLMEGGVITDFHWRAADSEARAIVWGPRS